MRLAEKFSKDDDKRDAAQFLINQVKQLQNEKEVLLLDNQ